MNPNPKWKFAIGHTSRVPHLGGGLHYLMADIDEKVIPERAIILTSRYATHITFQRTEHGWHMYSDIMHCLDKVCEWALAIGADPAWVKIGEERGYLFLADKSQIILPYQSEHMVLHWEENAKKEA